jgi:hypothetical protein
MTENRITQRGEAVCGKNVYKILIGKLQGKRPIGGRRWEDNIKIDLTVIRV